MPHFALPISRFGQIIFGNSILHHLTMTMAAERKTAFVVFSAKKFGLFVLNMNICDQITYKHLANGLLSTETS